MNKFYITTPIYYVNDVPHVGSAYTTIAADVLARYHRMIGDKTFFLTGTDEHGAKVVERAESEGKEPREFVNEIAAKFQFAWDELNISNDYFIRTTEKEHIKAVQKALQFMYDKGDIYKGKYEGLYCKGCEQYKGERDLVNGKCADHNVEPEKMSEECYMFKLSKYKDELLEKIKKDELIIRPEAKKNEIVSFYEKEGLNDIAFSRKQVKWGVPLPWDKSHTAYVWVDAFLNYLTGLGWDGTAGKVPEFWPPDVQLMSKDIMRVHATIWPAMLLSLELLLPKQIFVHGFFLVDGQKMSKSLGNVIRPEQMVQKYGVDGARYLLMSATSFGHDGDIGWKKFDEKYNADLANGLGNLVARTLSMTEKYFSGKVPSNIESEKVTIKKGKYETYNSGTVHTEDISVRIFISSMLSLGYMEFMRNLELLDYALSEIIKFISVLDGYISYWQPYKLIKEDKEKTAAVLHNCLEGIRVITWMIWPFMPETAEKIWQQLGLVPSEEMKKDFNEAIKWGGLPVDFMTRKSEVLFPRI